MCLTCGCNQPNERHGDARNITLGDLAQAATAAGVNHGKAAKNLRKTYKNAKGDEPTMQAAGAWPGKTEEKAKAPGAPA